MLSWPSHNTESGSHGTENYCNFAKDVVVAFVRFILFFAIDSLSYMFAALEITLGTVHSNEHFLFYLKTDKCFFTTLMLANTGDYSPHVDFFVFNYDTVSIHTALCKLYQILHKYYFVMLRLEQCFYVFRDVYSVSRVGSSGSRSLQILALMFR